MMGLPRCSTVVLHRQNPAVRETPDFKGLFRCRKSVAEREGFASLLLTPDGAQYSSTETITGIVKWSNNGFEPRAAVLESLKTRSSVWTQLLPLKPN